jgi:hypothetical protein
MITQKVGALEEGDVICYDGDRYVVSGVDWPSRHVVQVFLCGGPNDAVDWILPLCSGDKVEVIRYHQEDTNGDSA